MAIHLRILDVQVVPRPDCGARDSTEQEEGEPHICRCRAIAIELLCRARHADTTTRIPAKSNCACRYQDSTAHAEAEGREAPHVRPAGT